MTAKIKLKTSIFYIESDQQSNEHKQQQVAKQPKNQIVKESTRNDLILKGSHRLTNNLIGKGMFVPDPNCQQFQSQALPFKTKVKNCTQSLHLENNNKSLANDDKKQLISTKKQQVQSQQNNLIDKQKEQICQRRIMTVKKAKSLMFELDSQSDNQTQNVGQNIIINNNQQKIQEKTQKLKQNEQQQERQFTQEVKQISSQTQKKLSINTVSPGWAGDQKRQWVASTINQGSVLKCKIIKKNQFSNMLLSQFDMFFRDYLVHVASCKKFAGNIGSNYRISIDSNNFVYSSKNYVGKIRSIQSKDIYNIFSEGSKPEQKFNKSVTRQILATVRIKVGKGPRNTEVYVLKQGHNYFDLIGMNLEKQPNLETLYSIQQNRNAINLFQTRRPEWLEQKKSYYLDFDGRINQASIRNFILEDPISNKQVIMFGKNTNGVYNIDISHPLNPILGLAIAIPQLDRED